MTRDEAIEKFSHTRLHMLGERRSEAWVEMFEALGMLKLDDPKDIKTRVCTAIWKHPELKRTAPSYVLEALEDAGLKIVEK